MRTPTARKSWKTRVGVLALALTMAGPVLGSASAAGAAPDSTAVFHFKGRAGSAVLTDCSLSAPVGTQCRAVDVFAFEQRVNNDGDKTGTGPQVQVTLYAVTITAVEPFFDAVPIGFGFTSDATVKINGSLAKGSARADVVPLCDFGCDPSSPASIALTVEWTGFGPTGKFGFHDKFRDEFCFVNSRNGFTDRAANATGTVDGVAFVVPVGFQAFLQSDSSGAVQHCA